MRRTKERIGHKEVLGKKMTREGDVDLSVLSCELHRMKNFLHAIISISQKFLLMVSDQGEKEEFSFRRDCCQRKFFLSHLQEANPNMAAIHWVKLFNKYAGKWL